MDSSPSRLLVADYHTDGEDDEPSENASSFHYTTLPASQSKCRLTATWIHTDLRVLVLPCCHPVAEQQSRNRSSFTGKRIAQEKRGKKTGSSAWNLLPIFYYSLVGFSLSSTANNVMRSTGVKCVNILWITLKVFFPRKSGLWWIKIFEVPCSFSPHVLKWEIFSYCSWNSFGAQNSEIRLLLVFFHKKIIFLFGAW